MAIKPQHHALAIGAASHLANMGHISTQQRDQIKTVSKAKLARGKLKKKMGMKPMAFGSLAPSVDGEGEGGY